MVRMRCREEPAPIGEHMGECIVSLRGWHPALAQAELSALFPDGQVEVHRDWLALHVLRMRQNYRFHLVLKPSFPMARIWIGPEKMCC